MNLSIIKGTIIAGLLALGGGTTAAVVQDSAATSPAAITVFQDETPDAPPAANWAAVWEALHSALKEAAADALGLSVDELEAARANGTRLRDLLAQQGIDPEEFRSAMAAARAAAVQKLLDEGTITQAQADQILRHEGRHGRHDGPDGRSRGPFAEIFPQGTRQQILAGALGITVEELEAAHAAGKSLPELVEELGLNLADVQTNVRASFEAMVAQAVADGTITQAQADQILSHRFRGGPGGPRGGRGLGNPGGAGTQDSNGPTFGMPRQDA